MIFKKLALAAAITTLPMAGFAMTEMEDSFLSGVTGQDGIAIDITPAPGGISADIVLHDTDGLTGVYGVAHNFDGAIQITGFNLDTNGGDIAITVDAGDTSQAGVNNTTPVMHIGVALPANTVITTGNIAVANSQRDDAAPGWDVVGGTVTGTVLSSMTITLNGQTDIDIQLGNEPQGNMILIDTTITSGLTLSSLALTDAGGSVTGGSLGAVSVLLDNAGAVGDLDVQVGMDASAAGLVIELIQLGDATNGVDVKITDAYLGGSGTPIGDVYIKNLDLNGTLVTISGK